MNSEQTERHLRYLIAGLLHVGRLKRGDPLPSIRAFAADVGADHRVVAAAYRVLEAEGLVEIRPGSGVYLAGEAEAETARSETLGWLGEVLLEGWSRGVARREVAALVERCAASRVRCACFESNEDHMAAIAAELEEDFSLEVSPALLSPAADAGSIPRDALAAADVVATTVFHAAAVRAAAAAAGRPCIVLGVNPRFAAEVARRLARPDVVTVVADPRYGVRARAHLEVTPHRDNVRFLLVDELGGRGEPPVDLHGDTVLVTRAARRRLGLPEYHLIPRPPAYISPDSARELSAAIVELGLRA
jgi:DNA-binding transcriptional regulator YhcF (GntR family)